MNRWRVHLFYSGQVQGVGFRYNARQVALGYEVTGVVRNLLDGRVEMIAEGTKDELEAFVQGMRESGVGPLIRHEDARWEPAQGNLKGFQIVD